MPAIVQAGDPVLRKTATPVDASLFGSKELTDLVATMAAVMRAAPGVGLAAPQIGRSLSLLVMEDGEHLMSRLSPAAREARGRVAFPLRAIANPVLRHVGHLTATFFEGCLSVPGYMALVERSLEVEVTGSDERGEPVSLRVAGWPARILQHEFDHLQGTLYIDRMIPRTFGANAEVQARWLELETDEILRALGAMR